MRLAPAPAALALVVALALALGPVGAGAEMVHGEDAVFAGPGVTLAWGVLRTADEARSEVVIRVVAARGAHARLSMEGVDPFTRARLVLLDGARLGGPLDVRAPRAGFADLPRRELHLYRTDEDWRAGRPALTVYYLGVPDTTPEFATEAALSAYLDAALARLPRR